MKVVIAVKQVPDTSEMRIDADGSLVRDGVPAILNPYDEYALTSVMEMVGDGDEVIVCTMGPGKASDALRKCLELGAHRAYLITDSAFAGSDTWATARALSAFVKKFEPDADLYVFGRQAVDGDTGQVPYEVASLIGAGQFAYVESMVPSGDGFLAVQDYGDFRRTVKVPKGSVVSFGGVDPRGSLPSIRSMLKASGKEIVTLDRVDLGLGLYSVGLKGSMTRIVSTQAAKSDRRNRKVEIRDPVKGAEFIISDMEAAR